MCFSIRNLISLVTLGLLFGCTQATQYKRASNLSQIDKLLSHSKYIDEDVLVVFDFNYTLMYPINPCLHKNNIDKNKSEFKAIIGRLSHEQADQMLSKMMATQEQKLINDQLPSFLEKYSKVNFVVCSSSLENNADVYSNLLLKNGVKITNSYNLPNFEFLEFSKYISGYPAYKNGIIVTNRCSKGKVLISFLKRISHFPKVIIFIDNSGDKLEDVKVAIKSLKNIKLVLVVEYLEYKNKIIPEVSKVQFSKYWNEQVEKFLTQ